MNNAILLIDDEKDILHLLQRIITEETPYRVVTRSDPVAAMQEFQNQDFDLVITDLRMPGMDGIRVLEEVKRTRPDVPVIILTAYATIETAVETVQKGAFDYMTKPFRRERILLTLEKAMAWQQIMKENRDLRNALENQKACSSFVGVAPAVKRILERARQVAPTTATVLITGPSGTGKEVLARSIHDQSGRRNRKMVTVNCTAIPEQVLESELFGHVRGAFTGAWKDKRGLVAEAVGGTLFLDEIGTLNPLLQTKLLRLLQEGEYRPVGSVLTKKADIRFIAATNRNLKEAIKDNSFREDLYYRLNVVHLELPPLKARQEDIRLLTEHFLRKYATKNNKEINMVSPAAMQVLMNYDFPGNVRELENIIERGIIFCTGDILDLGDLGLENDQSFTSIATEADYQIPFREARDRVLRMFHRRYIETLLVETGGNISKAAGIAGIQRQYLHRLMKDANIDAGEFKGGKD